MAENFYDKVGRQPSDVAEGRKIPNFDISEDEQVQPAQGAPTDLINQPEGRVSPDQRATQMELGQAEGEMAAEETNPSPLAQTKKAPRNPSVTTQQQDSPLPRPLNIRQSELIRLADPDGLVQTSEEVEQMLPSNQISTEDFLRNVQGDVPDPDKPTYAPEDVFTQAFDTERFNENIRFENTEKPLTQFSFKSLNSSSIESPIINALASSSLKNMGLHFGSSKKTGIFPSKYGTSFNFGQTDFDTPLDDTNELGEEDFSSLETPVLERTGAQPRGSRRTAADNRVDGTLTIPDAEGAFGTLGFGQAHRPESFTEAKEFTILDKGFSSRQQQERKTDALGRFSASNIGRSLGDGIRAMFSEGKGNPLTRFSSAFGEEFNDREVTFDKDGNPVIAEPDETQEFLEPGLITTPIAALFNIATDEEKELSDFGQEFRRIASKDSFGDLTVEEKAEQFGQLPFSTQIESLFRTSLELFNSLGQAGTSDSGELFPAKPFHEKFIEEFQNDEATQAFLSQLGSEVDPNGEVEFDPMNGQFGEFGVGSLGTANYIMNMTPNLVMAGVNKLWDEYSNTAAEDENVFQQALSGYDYMLTAPPTENKTNLTPLAAEAENQTWWQWGAALGGDLVLGGVVDGLIGGAIRGAGGAVRFTEDLAKRFPNKSFRFVSDLEFDQPRLPPSKFKNGVTIEDKIKTDPYLNPKADPRTSNPTNFDNTSGYLKPSDDTIEEPTPFKPEPVTKETTVKPTEVTDSQGNTVTRQTTVVEFDGIQPRTRIDYYGNPKKADFELEEDAVVIGKGKGEYRLTGDSQQSTAARRVERTNAAKRVDSEDTPLDVNPANVTTYLMRGVEDDPRRLLPPMRAADKVINTRKPVPNFENTMVSRDVYQLTSIAKAFGFIRRDRIEPLKPSEIKLLREDNGDLFNFVGRPADVESITNPQARLAKKLPSNTSGEEGQFIRKLSPAQEAPQTPQELERLGEPQRALELRAEELDAERQTLRLNPVEEAEIQQVENYLKLFQNKQRQIEADIRRIQGAKNPREASKEINRYVKDAREFDELQSKATDRAVAKWQKDVEATRDIKRGSDELFTEKVAQERSASNLASDARHQQAQAKASSTVRRSRSKALEKFPEGLERESIEEEISQISYSVEANRVIEPANRAEVEALGKALEPQARELNNMTFYHGTNVDLSELGGDSGRIFSAVDPDVGGSASEIGIGVHLTSEPQIAEQYAQALPPLNRPQLDDASYLKNGATHKVGTNIKRPIRADIKTEKLPKVGDMDVGDRVRKIFKKVGEEHAPSKTFASKFKRAIRKNRSIQQYYDQFRRQLAENGEMTEQRVRAFQRDITRNLRLQGIDALHAKRQGEEVLNVLFPERIQQMSSNVDLPEATTLSRKQSRKFVDEQTDIGLQTTKANRAQSELSLADELENTHLDAYKESALESVKDQRNANEVRQELFDETRAQNQKDLDDAVDAIPEESEELYNKEWNPDDIISEFESGKHIDPWEDFDDDFDLGFGSDVEKLSATKKFESLEDEFDSEYLLTELRDAAYANDGEIPVSSLKNIDEETLDALEEAQIIRRLNDETVAMVDMEDINYRHIMDALTNCTID